jgi:ACS family D-galactonate transporter-like MFS transporter
MDNTQVERGTAIHHVLYFCMGMGLVLGVMTMNIPPALDALMAHYQVSYLRISVLITAMFWPHALIMLPAGILADRLPLKSNLMLCTLFITVGNLVALVFTGLNEALLGRVICGLGTGVAFVATMKTVALHSPQGRAGVFQAIFGSTVGVGSIASYALLPYLAELSWRWAYGLPGLMALALFIWALFLKPKTQTAAHTSLEPIKVAFTAKESWLLGLVHSISWGTVIGLGNWTPSLYAESLGQSGSLQFAWLGVLLMLINAAGRLVGGLVIIRYRPVTIIWISMLSIAAAYLALYLINLPIVVVAAVVLAMWWASANFGAIFQVASYSVDHKYMGSMLGLVNFLANLGAIFTTMLCGWFKEESGSFGGAFIILTVAALVAYWLGMRKIPQRD